MEVRICGRCPRVFSGLLKRSVLCGSQNRRSVVGAMSDRALKQAILFFGIVSFFLGKKALEGAGDETAALRAANQRAA
jgi:hypothetical protein